MIVGDPCHEPSIQEHPIRTIMPKAKGICYTDNMDPSIISQNMLPATPNTSDPSFAEVYFSLLASMPIVIALILVFSILSLFVLVSISAKLSRMVALLEDQSPSAAIIKENAERARRVTSGLLVSTLGVTLGIFVLFLRFETKDELTSQITFVTGISIILCSVAIPIYQSFFKRSRASQKPEPKISHVHDEDSSENTPKRDIDTPR